MKAAIIILSLILVIMFMAIRKIWRLYGESSRMYVKTTGELNHIIETYDIWLRLEHDGYSVAGYLKSKAVRSVALCRMTDIGLRLYKELKDNEIEVKYLVDAQDVKLPDIKYFGLNETCPEPVDLVIITDMFEYHSLKEGLKQNGYENIDSPDGILYAMLKAQAEEK